MYAVNLFKTFILQFVMLFHYVWGWLIKKMNQPMEENQL